MKPSFAGPASGPELSLPRRPDSQAVYALVDCNCFYVSCERVFRPDLTRRPVIVLSNNDGCIIARSPEAKVLGIPMGAAWFKVKKQALSLGVVVFSSNYPLYGDMSARVMDVLRRFSTDVEVYSIDEAFVRLDGISLPKGMSLTRYAAALRHAVFRRTGIPVSIGIGPTKTLAKVGNRLSKQQITGPLRSLSHAFRYQGVFNFFDLPSAEARDTLLEHVEVTDVWGVGHRHGAMLHSCGVRTARALRDMPDDWVRRRMSVVGLHTVLELRGISCLTLEEAPPARRSILSSRSFGTLVANKEYLLQAVTAYMTRAAEKLRREGLEASCIGVFIKTPRHGKGPRYFNSAQTRLAVPTCYSPHLIQHARRLLEQIWKPGYRYQKAGVLLFGLEPVRSRQISMLPLLDGSEGQKKSEKKLMHVADAINTRFGKGTLEYAAAGLGKPWKMKQEHLSPRYTSDWNELPFVR
ncbi:Y-family DNA polymerase [Oleidesulfovibrio sp.]|uniref:Y-family DNA polymerase n=1 Tax=Oleidesulfovibrio sp. TaxID=2909707 RepID=UPI003A849E9A